MTAPIPSSSSSSNTHASHPKTIHAKPKVSDQPQPKRIRGNSTAPTAPPIAKPKAGPLTPTQFSSAVKVMSPQSVAEQLNLPNPAHLALVFAAISEAQLKAAIPLVNQQQLHALFEVMPLQMIPIACAALSTAQKQFIQKDLFDQNKAKTEIQLTRMRLTACHIAVGLSTPNVDATIIQLAPKLLQSQIQIAFACMTPLQFKTFITKMTPAQLYETFKQMTSWQVGIVYATINYTLLKPILTITSLQLLMAAIPQIPPRTLAELLPTMSEEQLYATIPLMSKQQITQYLDALLQISDDNFEHYVDQFDRTCMAVVSRHEGLLEIVVRNITSCNTSQVAWLVPTLSLRHLEQIIINCDQYPAYTETILRYLKPSQKEELTKHLKAQGESLQKEFDPLKSQTEQLVSHLDSIDATVETITSKLSPDDDKEVSRSSRKRARKRFASIYEQLVNVERPALDTLQAGIKTLQTRVRMLSQSAQICRDGHINEAIRKISTRIERLAQQAMNMRKLIFGDTSAAESSASSSSRPSLLRRLKTLERTLRPAQKQSTNADSNPFNRSVNMELYTGAKAALESLKNWDKLDVRYDELVHAGLTSVKELAAHNISTGAQLVAFLNQ